MPAKLTYDDVSKSFGTKGYKLVSDEYVSSTTPLMYKCNNGHMHTRTYKYFSKGLPCLECQKDATQKKNDKRREEQVAKPRKSTRGIPRKFSTEFVRDYMKHQGCTLVTNEYTTDRVKLTFVCVCGREAEQNFNRFYHAKSRCNNADCIKKRMEASMLDEHGVTNAMYNTAIKNKLAKTNVQKYGVENVFANTNIKVKIRESNMLKYGVEYASQNSDVKEKMAKTNMLKYGSTNPFGSHIIQERIKVNNMAKYGVEWNGQRDDVKRKIQATFLDKYGSKCPLNSPEMQEKIKRDCFDRYGVEYHGSREDVISKRKRTILDKYGVESTLSLPEFHSNGNPQIKAKIEATMMVKYGTEHHMQNAIIAQKALHNSMKARPFCFPSGDVRKVQGYEDKVLEMLLKVYDEKEIFTKRTDMPEIWYIDEDAKYHRYYPDMYIPKDNLVIEVKSIYTYRKDTRAYHKKRKACLYAGLRFRNYMFKSRKHDRVCMHI
jgi:hypothetical protein